MSDAAGTVQWVADDASLRRLLDRLAGAEVVTLDTEFLGDRSFTPRLCLVQLGGPDVIACVDPMASLELEPLWAFLRDERVTKVLHAAENDLALLLGPCGRVPEPVFDTQVAAALCGRGGSIGYAAVCASLLDVTIDKSMQRTDWSQRPLSSDAVRYAADDVRFLRDVHRLLAAELDELGRSDWAAEEFAALVDPDRYRGDPAEAWLRIRGRDRLDDEQLVVLRELAQWRDLTARATNRPRRWILPDDVCLAASRRPPRSEGELRGLRGWDTRRHGQHAGAVLGVVAAAGRMPADPSMGDEAGVRSGEQATLELLQAVARTIAERHGLPVELLATTAELVAALRGRRDGRAFGGWRRAVLGDLLVDVLSGARRVRVADGRVTLDPPNP